MFQHLGQGQELQELELDGSLVYSFKPLLHQPPGTCGRTLRLWTLVESMTEAARCWALRLCLRLKWRKVHLGKGVQAKAVGKGSAAGRPEWAWDSREQREAMLDGRQLLGPQGWLPSEPIRVENLRAH